MRLDYEFRRNIVVSGWFDYLNQDYDEFPRVDNQYVVGAELRYFINRFFSVAKINYSFTDYQTNFNNINGAEKLYSKPRYCRRYPRLLRNVETAQHIHPEGCFFCARPSP
ncbi:outer membrane beta-barrel protein [Ancylobacter dichloromethanicus]